MQVKRNQFISQMPCTAQIVDLLFSFFLAKKYMTEKDTWKQKMKRKKVSSISLEKQSKMKQHILHRKKCFSTIFDSRHKSMDILRFCCTPFYNLQVSMHQVHKSVALTEIIKSLKNATALWGRIFSHARQEIYGKTTEKFVPSWERARTQHDWKYSGWEPLI